MRVDRRSRQEQQAGAAGRSSRQEQEREEGGTVGQRDRGRERGRGFISRVNISNGCAQLAYLFAADGAGTVLQVFCSEASSDCVRRRGEQRRRGSQMLLTVWMWYRFESNVSWIPLLRACVLVRRARRGCVHKDARDVASDTAVRSWIVFKSGLLKSANPIYCRVPTVDT
jgi:hypothetical protein